MKIIDWFKARSPISQAAILTVVATTSYFSYGTVLLLLGVALIADFVSETYL